MKILFLTQRVPFPPNKGDKLRAFNIIKHLSRNHSLSLACLTENIEDLKHKRELMQFCQSVDIVFLSAFWAKARSFLSLLSKTPLTLAYFYSKKLKRIIDKKIKQEQFDLIFIYSSSMAQYALNIEKTSKVIDFIDVDSDKWKQYAQHNGFLKKLVYKIEEKRLKKYEAFIAGSVKHCFVTSDAEAGLFKSFIPDICISAIPNGVDHEYFKHSSYEQEEASLIFTGQMDYFANIEGVLYFYRQILPLIKQKNPSVKFYIVGNNPTKEITSLADKNVTVTGYVQDIRPCISKATVCVAPLRIARGVQNKVLEAMAMGIPVVATSAANRGIKAKNKEEIFISDNPAEFAELILILLRDPGLRASVANRARKFIETEFNWENNLQKLEETLING